MKCAEKGAQEHPQLLRNRGGREAKNRKQKKLSKKEKGNKKRIISQKERKKPFKIHAGTKHCQFCVAIGTNATGQNLRPQPQKHTKFQMPKRQYEGYILHVNTTVCQQVCIKDTVQRKRKYKQFLKYTNDQVHHNKRIIILNEISFFFLRILRSKR